MKRTALVACLLLTCVYPPTASSEGIGLFSEPSAGDCHIYDTDVSAFYVYVFHVNSLGTTGSQFSVPNPACSQLVHLGDVPAFDIALGDSENGIAVAYGSCRTGTFLIMRISYLAQGLTGDCCYYPVLPDPREPAEILGADCNFELHPISGSPAIINPTSGCNCLIPVDDTNWGRIKALYR